MHVLDDLNEMLEEQVEKVVKKGDISPTELDNVYKAVKTMNYIETIYAMKEYGQSNEGGSNQGGSSRGSYGYSNEGGSSRANYRDSYEGGSNRGGGSSRGGSSRGYSEEGSYRRGRDAMGRFTSRQSRDYSRADEKEEMISKLEKMMESATSENERQTIMECIRNIEN